MNKIPESYDYEHLPVGTKIHLKGGQWQHIEDDAIVVKQAIDKVYAQIMGGGIIYVNEHWPCEIISYPSFGECFKCKGDIMDEVHYLCNKCRL